MQLAQRSVRIIGVPLDLGAGRRGVDMGPSAIRYARLAPEIEKLGIRCEDKGDVHTPVPEIAPSPNLKLRHLTPIVRVCRHLKKDVLSALAEGHFPLILGGDHSLSIGTMAAICDSWQKPGLIWVDAHGDFNTPDTTPSGNIHGMSLAVSTGRGAKELLALFEMQRFVDPRKVALIGVRDLDPGEKTLLHEAGVNVFTMTEVDHLGIQQVMQRALACATDGTDGVHVSFDMDVLNPDIAPGVGTTVEGGLSFREGHFLMEYLASSGVVRSLDVVEINPILDTGNRTAKLAVGLIASALGKTIF